MPVNKTMNNVLGSTEQLKEGIGVLARDEWVKLQSFTMWAISDTPATDELMSQKLNLTKGATLHQDFKDTVKLYATLKTNCSAFDTEIKPGTLNLADDIVQYQRRADVTYGRLIKLISDYSLDHKVSAEELKKLADEWKSEAPSAEADDIKKKFQTYVERLKTDAEERSKKATDLQTKLKDFQKKLTQSQSDFNQHFENYRSKYEKADKELDKLKNEKVQESQDRGWGCCFLCHETHSQGPYCAETYSQGLATQSQVIRKPPGTHQSLGRLVCDRCGHKESFTISGRDIIRRHLAECGASASGPADGLSSRP